MLELSSYQLELLETFHAHVAVWLNITPDHIDRHGDLAGYVAAKENIFARQQVRDCAVIGVDDQPSRAVYAKLIKRGIAAVPVKLETPVAGGISYRAGMLVDADGYRSISSMCRRCLETTTPRTPHAPGRPAAGSTCHARRSHRASGPIPACRIARNVASVGTVVYVNDSKATNADATARALSSYHDIYWILGGQAKEGGVAPLAPWFDRIRHAFLIGEATELFAGQLEAIAYSRCGDLKSALDAPRAHQRDPAEAEGTAGAAVAGLRLVGPVEELRAPWRCVPARRALPGAQSFGESSVIQVPRRPQRDRPMVVDRRPLVVGRHPGGSSPSASC